MRVLSKAGNMSRLYLVATPIGNLEDITLRALRILKEVDYIACEDTRVSIKLLNRYEIKKPLISYYKDKEKQASNNIIKLLKEGHSVALLSDAGTPCISDPGAVLVKQARNENIDIEVIPGACAVAAAASLCGIDSGFYFVGFLPDSNKDKKQLLVTLMNIEKPIIFYISPHSFIADADSIIGVFGDRYAYAVREMTKIYEQVQYNKLSALKMEQIRGEYVLIVEGKHNRNELLDLDIKEHLLHYIALGYDKKECIKLVSSERGLIKNEVYKVAIDL